GNKFEWSKKAPPTTNASLDKDFQGYLNYLMEWTGTLALDRDLTPVKKSQITIGDMWVYGNPRGNNIGHIVMAVDAATNESGQIIYLFGNGFIPAQDFHIIRPETFGGAATNS